MNKQKFLVSVAAPVLALPLTVALSGTAVASAGAASQSATPVVAAQSSSVSAINAYSLAAGQEVGDDVAEPQAIPALAAGAFVTGAAAGAGKAVGGWVARKLLGSRVELTMIESETVFD